MQVTLEKTSDLQGRIKVEVAQNDYLDKVNKELKEIGRTRVIPGFRKGHVSIDQLRRRFGKEVKSHVLNEEVYRAVIEYIRDNKLNVLGEPLPVEVKEINLDDADYTFEYEIGMAPELNINIDKSLNIPFYTIEVSDDMLKEQDTALCERFGAQVAGEQVDEKALVKGSIMQLNADGSINNEEGAIQVVDGIVAPMYFTDKEQSALFTGKKVGDKVVFNPSKTCNGNAAEIASMLHIDKDNAANVTDDFEFSIAEIIVLKPAEHGEEFYKEVFPGTTIASEDEYFAELRKMIAQQLLPNSEHMFNRDAQNAIMAQYGNFELPAEFLKKWLVARNEGLTAETADEEFNKNIPGIKWELVSGKIASNLDIKVTNDDMLNFAKALTLQQFAQYGMTNMDEETVNNYAQRILKDKNYVERMHQDVATRKLFNAIKALVTLEEKTVSLDEFKKLAQGE
jgi:trigger factor